MPHYPRLAHATKALEDAKPQLILISGAANDVKTKGIFLSVDSEGMETHQKTLKSTFVTCGLCAIRCAHIDAVLYSG